MNGAKDLKGWGMLNLQSHMSGVSDTGLDVLAKLSVAQVGERAIDMTLRSIAIAVLINFFASEVAYCGESFEYAKAAIVSLSYAKDAHDQLRDLITNASDTSIPSMVNHMRKTSSTLERAKLEIQQFTTSRKELIRVSAIGFHSLLRRIVHSLSRTELNMEAILNGRDEIQLGTLMNQMSQDAAIVCNAWKGLTTATVSVTHALIDHSRPCDGKQFCLNLTGWERQELLEKIELYFGMSIKEATTARQYPVEVAPAILYDFLKVSQKIGKTVDQECNDIPYGFISGL